VLDQLAGLISLQRIPIAYSPPAPNLYTPSRIEVRGALQRVFEP
jgi:hypothetical protein